MARTAPIWPDTATFLRVESPDEPVFLFAPKRLAAAARRFLEGFPGMVTYAVKANPEPAVLLGLAAAGVHGFDVASAQEIELVRSLSPDAPLHYHNPVKSRAEIAAALAADVRTFAADCEAELEKIAAVAVACGARAADLEISVRFRSDVPGGAYDFGSKFGATEAEAALLLARAAALGFRPSLTFHPGTQCLRPEAHAAYVRRAAAVAREAGVRLHRLNVGGGFPAGPEAKPLQVYFDAIAAAVAECFPEGAPALVCEPGRAMVAESVTLVTRVKMVRENGAVFLNDGIYGGLADAPCMGATPPFRALNAEGRPIEGPSRPAVVFGPTCDSLDRLPGEPLVPAVLAEGDYLVFPVMGAYATAIASRFNGYGALRTELVAALD